MRAERLLAGVLATAAALSPTATRRQLAGGLAGGGLALVAPPALAADVLEIPPATTKMGGLLEKYADVNRGFRLLKPTTWNQFDGEPGAYDVRWVDVVAPAESVTLSTSSYNAGQSIEDLAAVDKLGAKLAAARGTLTLRGHRSCLPPAPSEAAHARAGRVRGHFRDALKAPRPRAAMAARYDSLADSPDSDDDEATPLRRQRQKNDSGWWVRGALLLGLAVLASLVLASQPADETRRQRRDEAKRRSSLSAPKKHAYCVAHGAYGNYTRVARVASRSKRAYARSRGYGFVELLAESRDDFLETHCPELRGEAERAFSKTTPVKACGVWAALRDSCEAVLWTDADSIVVDGRLGVDELLGDREAAFFLETTGVSGDCGTADEFAAHVDAGAFVLKSGSWAEVLLRQQLALSIFDNEFLEHSPCSTRGLDPLNPNWDQCHYAGKTEQCTLGCLYRTQPQLLERTRCVYASLSSSPLGGVLLEPDYQVAAYGVNASSVAEFLGDVFPAIAPRADGLLVFNCMGGTAAEKVLCVEWATAFYGGGGDK